MRKRITNPTTFFLTVLFLLVPHFPANARTIYVDAAATGINDGSSWSNAFMDLQSALASAMPGDEIWVAAGTYKPTAGNDRTATFQLVNGVALYGGFAGTETTPGERDWVPNVTILSGDIGVVADSTDNSYHVVTGSGTDSTAVLDGFIVTDGNADGMGTDQNGGGMINNGGSPEVTNVTFSKNSAIGGAGMNNANNSSPILTNVIFSGNFGFIRGGGMYNHSSNPTLTNVTFLENAAFIRGGGIRNTDSNPTLTSVIFWRNGAINGGGINDKISTCSAAANKTSSGTTANAVGGGIDNWNSSLTLTNVIFYENFAFSRGGGIFNDNSSNPVLTNVTFSENYAIVEGGGMYNNNSSPILYNSILWGDSAGAGEEIYNNSSSPIISFSLIGGSGGSGSGWDASLGTDGGNNIDADPLFANTEIGDLRLRPFSPAIDAGDSLQIPAGITTDLDGNPRIHGDNVDVGAYEYSPLVPALLRSFNATYRKTGIEISWLLAEAGARMEFFVSRAEASSMNFQNLPNPYIVQEDLSFTFVDKSYEPGSTYIYRVDVSDEHGRRRLFETKSIETPALILSLDPNYPNPFNPQTTIVYSVPESKAINLRIYDVKGRLIRILVNETKSAGTHRVIWDGRDSNGRCIASGVYFVRLEAAGEVRTGKIVLLR